MEEGITTSFNFAFFAPALRTSVADVFILFENNKIDEQKQTQSLMDFFEEN
jgi:hypothetical protein